MSITSRPGVRKWGIFYPMARTSSSRPMPSRVARESANRLRTDHLVIPSDHPGGNVITNAAPSPRRATLSADVWSRPRPYSSTVAPGAVMIIQRYAPSSTPLRESGKPSATGNGLQAGSHQNQTVRYYGLHISSYLSEVKITHEVYPVTSASGNIKLQIFKGGIWFAQN